MSPSLKSSWKRTSFDAVVVGGGVVVGAPVVVGDVVVVGASVGACVVGGATVVVGGTVVGAEVDGGLVVLGALVVLGVIVIVTGLGVGAVELFSPIHPTLKINIRTSPNIAKFFFILYQKSISCFVPKKLRMSYSVI